MLISLLSLLGMAAATSQPSWVTSIRDRYPTLSPDGRTLLFESNRGGASELFLADADGRNVRLLVGGDGGPSSGSWCPDGNRIVFNQRVDGEFDVFVINRDGSGKRNLTNSPTEESHPHCDAAGRIYFNSDRDEPDRSKPWGQRSHNLYRMAADGSDIVRLTKCTGLCTNPNPTPDGTRIAFRLGVREPALSWAGKPSPLNSEIAVLDVASGTITNLTRNQAYDTWPTWSPDGKWVAYGSSRLGIASQGQLFATRADGSRTVALTGGNHSFGEPSFAPDGKSILFSKSIGPTDGTAAFIASMPVELE